MRRSTPKPWLCAQSRSATRLVTAVLLNVVVLVGRRSRQLTSSTCPPPTPALMRVSTVALDLDRDLEANPETKRVGSAVLRAEEVRAELASAGRHASLITPPVAI